MMLQHQRYCSHNHNHCTILGNFNSQLSVSAPQSTSITTIVDFKDQSTKQSQFIIQSDKQNPS